MRRAIAALLAGLGALSLTAFPAFAQAQSCEAAKWLFDIMEARPAPEAALKRGVAIPADQLGNFLLNEHALEFDATTSSLDRFELVRQDDSSQRLSLKGAQSVKAGGLDFLVVHVPDAVGKVHFAPNFRVIDNYVRMRVISSANKQLTVGASKREPVVVGAVATKRPLACPVVLEVINVPSYRRGDSGSLIVDDNCNLLGITSKFAAGKDLFNNASDFHRILKDVAKQDPASLPAAPSSVDDLMQRLWRYERFAELLERTDDVSIVSGYCMLASYVSEQSKVDLYQQKGAYRRQMFKGRASDFGSTLLEMRRLTDIAPFMVDVVEATLRDDGSAVFALKSLAKFTQLRGIDFDALGDLIPERQMQTPPAAGPSQNSASPPQTGGAAPAAGPSATKTADGDASRGHGTFVSDLVLIANGQLSRVPAPAPRLLSTRLSDEERLELAAEMGELAQTLMTKVTSQDDALAAQRLADGAVSLAVQVASKPSTGAGQGLSSRAYTIAASNLLSYSRLTGLIQAAQPKPGDNASAWAKVRERIERETLANHELNVATAELSARAVRLDWGNPQAWSTFAKASNNLGDYEAALKAASISAARGCMMGAPCIAEDVAGAARAKITASAGNNPLVKVPVGGMLRQFEVVSPDPVIKGQQLSPAQQKSAEELVRSGSFGPNAIGTWGKAASCPSCLPVPEQMTSVDAVIGNRGTQF